MTRKQTFQKIKCVFSFSIFPFSLTAFNLDMVLIFCLRSFDNLEGERRSPEMLDCEGLEALMASTGSGYVASDVFLTFTSVAR